MEASVDCVIVSSFTLLLRSSYVDTVPCDKAQQSILDYVGMRFYSWRTLYVFKGSVNETSKYVKVTKYCRAR